VRLSTGGEQATTAEIQRTLAPTDENVTKDEWVVQCVPDDVPFEPVRSFDDVAVGIQGARQAYGVARAFACEICGHRVGAFTLFLLYLLPWGSRTHFSSL